MDLCSMGSHLTTPLHPLVMSGNKSLDFVQGGLNGTHSRCWSPTHFLTLTTSHSITVEDVRASQLLGTFCMVLGTDSVEGLVKRKRTCWPPCRHMTFSMCSSP